MYAGEPRKARDRLLSLASPLRAVAIAVLVVVVAFTPPLMAQANATSNPGITASAETLEIDEGECKSYTVVLDSQPSSDATVTVNHYYQDVSDSVSFSQKPCCSQQTTGFTADGQGLRSRRRQRLQLAIRPSPPGDRNGSYAGRGGTVEVNLIDDDRKKWWSQRSACLFLRAKPQLHSVVEPTTRNDVTVTPWSHNYSFTYSPSSLTLRRMTGIHLRRSPSPLVMMKTGLTTRPQFGIPVEQLWVQQVHQYHSKRLRHPRAQYQNRSPNSVSKRW